MQTEDAVLNYCTQWNMIKHICQHLPNILRPVLPRAFIVKPVGLGEPPRLMVASGHGDPISVPNL